MLKAIIRFLSHKFRVVMHLDADNHPSGFISYSNANDPTTEIKGYTIFETGSSVISKLNDCSILKCLKIRNWPEYNKLFLEKHRAKEEVQLFTKAFLR